MLIAALHRPSATADDTENGKMTEGATLMIISGDGDVFGIRGNDQGRFRNDIVATGRIR